ncbi:MAG: DUF892 family protein [Bacteroidota bacterium]|nr:DUF892 family protein [Bacteroidota bacterium]
MAKLNSLKDLFKDQLKVLYYSEKEFLDTLNKVEDKVSSDELKNQINQLCNDTEGQVKRLEEVFSKVEMESEGKKCPAMDGVIDEINEVINEDADPKVIDAAIIAEIQKGIHFKIASYGTLKTYAKMLNFSQVADRMKETIQEEKNTDKKFTEIADRVNQEANVSSSEF